MIENTKTYDRPDWFFQARFDGRYLPRSQGQAALDCQRQYAPLQAAVALISGHIEGDLDAVRALIISLHTDRPLVCKTCGHRLSRTSWHAEDCA